MGAAIPSLQAGLLNQSSAQMVDGGLRFNPGDSPILSRTVGSGNRATWTWSGWIKRSGLTVIRDFFSCGVNIHNGGAGGAQANAYFEGDGTLQVIEYSGGYGYRYKTTQVFRDASDWYHIVISLDTTNSTAGDRVKIYVNGNRVTSFTTSTAPALNFEGEVNRGGVLHYISDTVAPFDGYLSQINFIDGQSLGPENFGFTDPLTNTWRPKKYTGDFNSYTLTAPTYRSSSGSDVTSTEFDKMVDNNLSTYGQGNGASGTNRFIGFNLSSTAYPSINVKIKNTTGGALDFMIQPSVSGSGIVSQGTFASTGNNNGTVNVAANTTLEDTFSFPSGYEGFGRIYLNNSGNAADAWEIYDFGGTKVTTNSFYLPLDGNSPIGEDKSGNGNNWTPNNFGGSVALDKATGALPILNTDGGGNVARPGVFGSEVGAYYAVTVAAVGGGNRYHFDGVDRPNPTLIRGATYTFDQSDSSNSGHPLRFATAADAAGSSQYTDGVSASGTPGSAGAYTKITVPHNSPNTLHYYCTNHGGMGSSTSQITDETKADPYAWKNTLALPLVGNSSDVSNSVNSGSTTKTITNNGVNTSNANSNFYGGSHYWDGGTTDRLTVTYNSEFQFGTGDFCVEFWVNLSTTSGNQYFWDFDTNGGNLQYNSNVLSYSDGVVAGSGPLYSTGITLPTDKWVHLAFTRESGTGRIFVDGAMRATGTTTYNYNQTSVLDIGNGYNNSGYEITGYMQDFRIYKGVAKYTNSFVVPATSPDILPDTPSGVSGSSKLTKITDGAVSFDGTGDYLSLGSNSDFNFGTGTFTIEGFFYKNATTSLQTLLASQQYYQSGNDGNWVLRVSSATQIAFASYNGTSSEEYSEFSAPNGVGSWHHFAFVREGTGSNQSKFYYDGKLAGSMTVSKSLTDGGSNGIFIGDDGSGPNNAFNGFLSNVRVIKGTALYTANFTPPSAPLTNVTNTKLLCCQSNTSAGAADVTPVTGNTGYTGTSKSITLNQSNLDAGTIANVVDGSTSTSADLRGAGSFVELIFPQQQNGTLQINVANGNDVNDDDIRVFIDGVEGTSFDVSSQSWYTIHTGDFTTVKLEHQGSTTGYIYGFRIGTGGATIISKSVAPVRNAAASNFNPFTTDINTVRGQETGYPTWNPLVKSTSTTSDGNLTITTNGGSGYPIELVNTFTPAGRGQWYWEFTLSALSGSNYTLLGMIPSDSPYIQGNSNNFTNSGGEVKGFSVYVGYNGSAEAYSGAATPGSATATIGVGGVVGWAYDAENGTLKCSINGVPQGTQFTNIRTDVGWLFGVTDYDNSATASYTINFGQKPFKFPPPAGYQPLNAPNVRPETVITRPDHYVGVVAYTGDGNSPREIGGFGFQPDLVVYKERSEARDWQWYDSVRGVGPAKNLVSNTTYAQTANDDTQYGYTSSFNKDGFTVTNGTGGGNANIYTNKNGQTYASWTWRAGGNKNTFNVDDVGYASAAAAGLDGGTLDPSGASVNTKSKFGIYTWNGHGSSNETLAHGLGAQPDFMICKKKSTGGNSWVVWHKSIGTTKYLILNSQAAAETDATLFNSHTNDSDNLWSLGTNNSISDTGQSAVAYLWCDVPGLQKFGSFEANQDADGPFVELGFRPAVVWIKNIDNYNPPYDWVIYDNARSTINPNDKFLCANLGNVENSGSGGTETTRYVDFLSNGFKVRTASTAINLNAHTQIYCAWAEAPTFNLFGGQSNAH